MTIFPEQDRPPEAADWEPVEEASPVRGQPRSPFVADSLTAEDYAQIRRILKAGQGLDLQGYKDLCIKRRIANRIRALGFHTAEPYIAVLAAEPTEQEQLLAALTIHVSQFFRNPSMFASLEKEILPELLQRARRSKSKLRIWSAGCAGGEEPYSLALLCRELLQAEDRLSLIATDLSANILQQAKQGTYAPQRVAGVALPLLQKYFLPHGKGYRLRDEILEMVRFFRHDILCEQPFFRADLVLCRNLLIYFTRAQQERILLTLAKVLPPGGYLVLGRAETLVTECRELFRCHDPAERIYQRLASPVGQVA